MSTLRHAILGAGGVGGTVGALLAQTGAAVTMVVRPESFEKHPEQIHLKSTLGDFRAKVDRAVAVPACDVLWMTVKATQFHAALRAVVSPRVVGAIVPLLNGVDHLLEMKARFGDERVIAGTIAGEMERVAPGEFVHSTPFLLLNLSARGQDLLGGTLEDLKKLGMGCRFTENEATLMWSKLVFLAPFALTTSAADRTTGEVSSDPAWSELMIGCVREACAVGVAEGASVDAEVVIPAMMKMPPNMRSSMQKDVERGNLPELDAIAGPILRGAARHGIAAPVTLKLVAAVEQRTVGTETRSTQGLSPQ